VTPLRLTVEVIAVLAAGLVAGGQVFIMVVAAPVMKAVPNATALKLHQLLFSTDLPDQYLVPCALTVVFAGAVLFGIGGTHVVDLALTSLAMAAIVATAVVSERVNRPLNRLVAAFQGDPAGYAPIRDRWIRFHRVRVVLGCTAFVAFTTRTVVF
jgi:hypothetical protein